MRRSNNMSYCKFENFRKNFIFTSSIKRHICDVKNSQPGHDLPILTSTKNASLIITDFLAMIKENEQRRTASLCRDWAMLENDFNLICR